LIWLHFYVLLIACTLFSAPFTDFGVLYNKKIGAPWRRQLWLNDRPG
jgi:hypothetical protein